MKKTFLLLTGIVLSFCFVKAQLPQVSTESDPVWYYIQTKQSEADRIDRVLTLLATDEGALVYGRLIGATESVSQLWRFEQGSTSDQYVIINEDGKKLGFTNHKLGSYDFPGVTLQTTPNTEWKFVSENNHFLVQAVADGRYFHQANTYDSRNYSVMLDGSYKSPYVFVAAGQPTLSASPTSVNFGNIPLGSSSDYQQTISISGLNLQGNITYEFTNEQNAFTVAENSWNAATGGTLNVNFTAKGTAGEYTATLTIKSSGADNITINISAKTIELARPTLSSVDGSSEVWYYIASARGKTVFSDFGVGTNLICQFPQTGQDGQLWKLVGTDYDNFKLVNKLGHELGYEEGLYTISETSTRSFALGLSTYNYSGVASNAVFVLKDNTGSNIDKKTDAPGFGQWGATDSDGTALTFVLSKSFEYAYPRFSTEQNTYWYNIQLARRNTKLVQNNGIGAIVTQETATDGSLKTEQLFKFVGTLDGFKIVSYSGDFWSFSSDRIIISNEADAHIYKFATCADKLLGVGLQDTQVSDHGGHLNDNEGSQIGTWNQNDAGNAFKFIELPFFPAIEESESAWFYITMSKPGGYVLESVEAENNVLKTKAKVENSNAQLWKLLATQEANKYTIVNKATNKALIYEEGGFKSVEGTPATFTIVSNTSLESLAWELKYNEAPDKAYLNQFGGAGLDKPMGLWNHNDQNNTLQFELWTDPGDGTNINNIAADTKAKLFVDGKLLQVKGNDIQQVSIYSITGQKLQSQTDSFEFFLSQAGTYIVSVHFNDGTKELLKTIVK